jgi:hypothetical protein
MNRAALLVPALILTAAIAFAEDVLPNAKIFKGSSMQKGQWRVDVIDTGSQRGADAKPFKGMTICLDRAEDITRDPGSANQCESKLLKDTATIAVIEVTCPDSNANTTITRESYNSYLMDSTGVANGKPYTMRARYTFEGECKTAGATIRMDRDSETCRKIREELLTLDPEEECADSPQREKCEQQIEQMEAMCM